MLLQEHSAADHWQALLAEHSNPQMGQQPAAGPMAADMSGSEVKPATRRTSGKALAWGGLGAQQLPGTLAGHWRGGFPSAAVTLGEQKAGHLLVSNASRFCVRA